jgi:putative endonuclease
MAAKDELGRRGEDLAAKYLLDGGMRVIERNWRCARGEIDIVLLDGDELVFAEVKTRSSVSFGHPLEAITVPKLRKPRQLAGMWCEQHPTRYSRVRIDAVAVVAPAFGAVVIEHLKRVF